MSGESDKMSGESGKMSGESDQLDQRLNQRLLSAIRKDIICGIDGYNVYWPERLNGGLDAATLRVIADELDRSNKSWHEQVVNDHNLQ